MTFETGNSPNYGPFSETLKSIIPYTVIQGKQRLSLCSNLVFNSIAICDGQESKMSQTLKSQGVKLDSNKMILLINNL